MGDLSNLRKSLEKSGLTVGLASPDNWASFGNMSLNFICTGSFTKGIPNRRSVMFYGPSGTGKSFLMGMAAKQIQDMGYKVIYIDTEYGLDEEYLTKIGLDIDDESKFICIQAHTIEEVANISGAVFSEFDEDDKIALFVDSLGMIDTVAGEEAFEKSGELKNDMGLKAKKTKQLLVNLNKNCGKRDMFCIVNQHSYQNQNITDGRGTDVPSGGEAQIYVPSITILLKKLNLKEGTEIIGVKIKAEAKKTRFNKLSSKVELEVPYEKGMDPLGGVLDILVDHEVVDKKGAWYSFVDDNGETVKFQRNKFHMYGYDLIEKLDIDEEEIEEDDDSE